MGEGMKDFDGKVAFVTGGASGIGLGLARKLAEAGARVTIADVEQAALDAAVEELRSVSRNVRGVVCDVSDANAVHAAADRMFSGAGKVNVLCNNAGVSVIGLTEETPARDWQWLISVNLMGVVHGLQAFLPRMKRQGEGGYIVNTASGAGLMNPGMISAYCATKFAIVGITEGLAAELAGTGIGVSVLCPSYVATNIASSARNRPARFGGAPDLAPDDPANPMSTQVELLRTGLPPDVVAARTLEAVAEGQLYVFTHPEMRGAIDERYASIKAGFDSADRSAVLKAAG